MRRTGDDGAGALRARRRRVTTTRGQLRLRIKSKQTHRRSYDDGDVRVRLCVSMCVIRGVSTLVFYAVVVFGVFDERADERRRVDAIRRERIRRHFRDSHVVRVAPVGGYHGEIAHG